MNNPAQGELPYDVPAYRPAGSPVAQAYGASDGGTGEAKTLAALKALFETASEQPSPAPTLTPSAARTIRTDIQVAQKALDAETDPVEKATLAAQLTQLRLKALFSGAVNGTAAKAAGTMPVESDDAKLNAAHPVCGNCGGGGTVPVGNFEHAECPGCKGAGRISPGDRARNHASSSFDLAAGKGLSPVSKQLWARLDRDLAAAKALEEKVRSGGRLGREKVAKSTGDSGFQAILNFVQQNRQTR